MRGIEIERGPGPSSSGVVESDLCKSFHRLTASADVVHKTVLSGEVST
jgi:hypothetical protein